MMVVVAILVWLLIMAVTGGVAWLPSLLIGCVLGYVVKIEVRYELEDSADRVYQDQRTSIAADGDGDEESVIVNVKRQYTASMATAETLAQMWFWACVLFPPTAVIFLLWRGNLDRIKSLSRFF